MKKILMVLSLSVLAETGCAQKINDSTILISSDQQLGLRLLQKSKKQKAISYIFMGVATAAATMAYVISREPEPTEEGFVIDLRPAALGIVAFGSSATSVVLFTAGMKNSGKSEMLLRKKSPVEAPGYELDLGMKYRRKARQQKMIGMGLLGSGILLFTASDQTIAAATAGFIAVAASVPFIVKASKNKGRASVMLKKECIPFSYYSKPVGINSVALSISLSNSR